jgi:hypothetical protein
MSSDCCRCCCCFWCSNGQWAQWFMVMQTDAVVGSADDFAAGMSRMTTAMRAEPQGNDAPMPPMLVRCYVVHQHAPSLQLTGF